MEPPWTMNYLECGKWARLVFQNEYVIHYIIKVTANKLYNNNNFPKRCKKKHYTN